MNNKDKVWTSLSNNRTWFFLLQHPDKAKWMLLPFFKKKERKQKETRIISDKPNPASREDFLNSQGGVLHHLRFNSTYWYITLSYNLPKYKGLKRGDSASIPHLINIDWAIGMCPNPALNISDWAKTDTIPALMGHIYGLVEGRGIELAHTVGTSNSDKHLKKRCWF